MFSLDKTFCISPKCENKCGRKMNNEEMEQVNRSDLPISCGYFCGEPENE